ncbi:MAG TPA: Gfo/Idh/MocA family oxidoreductase [Vicinamibacteria bacterium]|nr:Gfo/Idh/MocA family oxidoreductase [Vicinamibacteria bacterium]
MARTAVKVLHVGLGPIGQGVARLVAETDGLQVVGATDPAPEAAGKDLGLLLGLNRRMKVKVAGNPDSFIRKSRADVAILCTSSSLKAIKPQVAALVQRGMNVVATCEEMAYPTPENMATFRELDKLAKKKKVTVLSTGVNPGYTMDALALMLTAPCARVTRVAVTRVVDAGTRRLPLQRKVGAGLNLNQFRRAITEGTVRHVGLVESVYMIAAGLGWKVDRVEETLDPAIAPRDLDTDYLRIPAGAAAGIRQHARGWIKNEPVISLDLQMYVGAESPRDHVLVDGTPPIDMTISGGVAGDIATAAIVVNAIPKVMAAPAGLLTMKDLPLLHHLNTAELKELAGGKARKKK